MSQEVAGGPVCPVPEPPDWTGIERLALAPDPPLADYRAAMTLAGARAAQRLAEPMLIAWYDRDRDFESPQHASECHQGGPSPAMWTTASTMGRHWSSISSGAGSYFSTWMRLWTRCRRAIKVTQKPGDSHHKTIRNSYFLWWASCCK